MNRSYLNTEQFFTQKNSQKENSLLHLVTKKIMALSQFLAAHKTQARERNKMVTSSGEEEVALTEFVGRGGERKKETTRKTARNRKECLFVCDVFCSGQR